MNNLPTKKEYLQAELRTIRFRGSGAVLLGCLALLIWSVSELVTRVDAMDGMVIAYFNLVRNGEITLMTALKNLAASPEAVKDLWTPLYLAGMTFISILFALMNGHRSSLYIYLPLVILILFTGPGGTLLEPLFTVSFAVKAGSAAFIFLGSSLSFADYRMQKRLILRKYKKLVHKHNKRIEALPRGRNRTMIPERTKRCR